LLVNKVLESIKKVGQSVLEWVVDAFLKFKKLAGIGSGLPYSKSIITSSMVSQELPMSCGPACTRQLLKDAGLDISEEMIRTLSKFNPKFGTQASDLAYALNKLFEQENLYQGGGVEPEAFNALVNRGSWIARVKLSTGPHFVIVDEIKDDKVLIRDPWSSHSPGSGNGLACEIDIEVFKEYWRRGIHQVVFK
jgi:ABC-type bacteriocin/lantibiotic exporter with double-glycine peptidase domain